MNYDLIMFTMYIIVLSLFGLLHSGVGQIIQIGQCNPNQILQADFQYENIVGTWYEIRTTDQRRECSTYDFIGDLNVTRSGLNENFEETLTGTLSVAADAPARLSVTWTSSGGPRDFWVLTQPNGADFVVFYECGNISPTQRSVSLWVLSKTDTLTGASLAFVNTALVNGLGIQLTDVRLVSRTEVACYALPDIQPGNPIILPGLCDQNINVVQNFNVSAFTGLWHEVASYYSENSENVCTRAEYTLEGSVVNVVNSQVIGTTLATITGNATVASTDNSARLRVTLLVGNDNVEQDLWILATDYDSYAISYTCVDNVQNDTSRVFSWILSRRRQLSETAQQAVNQVIASELVLNSVYYQSADQSDEGCFYYPDPIPNTPVVFRGSCNQSIAVVQEFNATAYMGIWHDIESYPSVFQTGTCRNANYELTDRVEVLNTQVIDQALDIMIGFAIPVAEDGSAKLQVSFPIAGTPFTTTTDYWVLATDYNNYALVYTCVEDPEREEKTVWSWKLSRTKQLTQGSQEAINNAIAGVPVLDSRYFVPVDQSLEGCFFFPEPEAGKPVVFPGQCNNTISVVQNFNLARFAGIWHEIQAYPKDQQTGQCVNHDYTIGSGNTLELQSSQVTDQFLDVTNGTLTFASATDNSARLIITLFSGIQIDFWILDTDYENYALAYSCENRGEDFQAIFSWKLSRTQELLPASNESINNAMANIDVLDNIYFEDIDQSDEACFFLPDLAPGEEVILVGQCDTNVPVIQNFNASAYLGRWHLIETYPSAFQLGECNDADYSLNNDGTVRVFNTEVADQTLLTIEGYATIEGNAKLLVYFPTTDEPSEYYVLDTDYDSYALVYSCRNLPNNQRQVWSWKMSRTRSLTAAAEVAINQKIDTVNVLNNRFYQQVNNSDEACFYFPDPDPTSPVMFRGRCDQNIQTVQNFNVTEYLGLWHNIELYPSVFQRGSCSNARYSFGTEGVDVFNTQVIGQTLDTMTGLAVVASDDGSAKLNVTFPIGNTGETITTNYWVLTTDYENYALVYTCQEIDEEYRLIYSWKLSRTRQLSAAATNAINAVTSGIQVLDDRYYSTVDQSPGGCFYFPEPEAGRPVVFRGTCDDTIAVVPNFNLDRFQGIWHEIEAYPKEEQQDQCINHEYTLGQGNTLNLQSSQVGNLSLTVNNGVLSFSSNDSSARMTITITVDGQVITIPFWILETDYDNYALAYSCVDLPEEHRGVYSWKLSRNRTELSNDAVTNINRVIDTVDVLDQRYYEPIDQSDDACFYLPVLAPGEPVIFRGQCDENIAGIPNFDVARYLGVWRSIETYPSEFQGGSCIQANYILGEGGVIVANTQVLNQTLDVMNGTATVGSTDGSGLLLVDFPTSPELARYYVLATDYQSYSLVYSCRNINTEERQVWAWKLSRDRTLSPQANNAISAVVSSINVLNDDYFEDVSQSQEACFYFPEPDNRPVVFRGQCDESVAVVQNFDVEAYNGTWYDIESFPQNFQGGSCPIARYTLNGDVVDVYNTQVIDQELDEINAVAVPATNDGSAKLDVTFPVAGTNLTVTTPYWVLATDYTNYVLVYSCTNIDEDSYRVTSWKLSRERSLSTASNAAIANAQANVKELRDDYYLQQEHTEDACFYYPDNNGGPVIIPGQCEDPSDVQVVADFDTASFAGTWYEIEHFPSEFRNGRCVVNRFSVNQNGLSIDKDVIYGERLNIFGGQLTVANDNRGVLTVNLENDTTTLSGTVFVLDVAYNDYALLYGCRNYDGARKQVYSWKLSRSQSLSANAVSNIDRIVSERRYLAPKYYELTGQDDDSCFYYPVFEHRPNSIRLRGSCDTSIRGVPNFDAAQYLGRWIEIASYPDPNQFGECARAHYSLGNSVVDVSNTQVVNRTLLTQDGIAVVASTDGTGQLEVTFVVNGQTVRANYYILATDYSNYALVYSCRNLEEGGREVFSWKLGRTNTLNNAANAAINAVVESTQGLLEDYYETTSQTDEDCFFVPEYVPNQLLRFRGRCDDVTNGLFSNFNSQRYLKRWHEIERYPSATNGGSCVSTVYQSSGNTITFEGTRVFGVNDGRVVTGTATMNANGRIERTYSDGTTEVLWVVATDYDNYSLLLSCQQVDDEFINVWSAKHSTTRSLSTAAENALAPVIAENDLLYQDFFSPVPQTDDACFYYPEQDGQTVIIPGQCDTDIPTQPDFDLTAYTGDWYQIERYPYPQIRSNTTCVGTRYTQQGDTNVVDIVNWENYDGDLETIGGIATLSNESAVFTVVLQTDPEDEEATATADLYVLTTDYTTYSLVYTCLNIDQYRRVVVAIKLSRTRDLPTASQTAINTFMATRQELHQPYFISVEHNEECRDPSASYLIKSSIIVTLLCVIIQTLM